MTTVKKTGIILPPPELRSIVDKTAQFVSKNGPEFEARIQENEKNNPKFCFLQLNDPYRPYYDAKILEYKSSGGTEPKEKLKESDKHLDGQPIQDEKEITETRAPLMEPPVLDFIIDTPNLSVLDLDIIKLTALFVARNGRVFMNTLSERESRNYQFDFLKPSHSLFSLFSRFVDAYSKILSPSHQIFSKLADYVHSKENIMKNATARAEWLAYKEEQDAAAEEKANKEKQLFASIDWHNFVVVETLEFNPVVDDTMEFPEPIDLQYLNSLSLAQKQEVIQASMMSGTSTMAKEKSHSMDYASDDQGEEEMEMEMEMDMENDTEAQLSEELVEKLTDRESEVPIVTTREAEYIPRALAMKQESLATQSLTTKCALCGRLINNKEYEEHLRVELLDPKYKEQKLAYMEKHKDSNLDVNVALHLKSLAGRRTDIFGREEVKIGKRIGEMPVFEHTDKEKVIWDGSLTSIEATKAAQMTMAHRQMVSANQAAAAAAAAHQSPAGHHILQSYLPHAPLPPPPFIPKGPMPMPSHAMPQMHPMPPGSMMPFGYVPVGIPPHHPGAGSYPVAPPGMMAGSNVRPLMMPPLPPPPPLPPLLKVAGHTNPLPVDSSSNVTLSSPPVSLKVEEEEVTNKKVKIDSPDDSYISLFIQMPNVNDDSHSGWSLFGQLLSVESVPVTLTINELKERVTAETGLPNSRQKIVLPNQFVPKNTQTLAESGITSTMVLHLSLKERGGKK